MTEKNYHIFFNNLANPLKIKVITALSKKSMSVGEICREIKVEQSKLSHALASLKECRIVNAKQEGKQRIYFLNKNTIVPMLKIIDKHSKNICGSSCGKCAK
ncbi:hypothetical protein COU58_04245 [Candidatus Pacearchaeota archaeon CG10_big_fil_rev_8_21_14_0_10_32_42]|nr:MAG: hypothetical protein COU58_04245 [Candidatus Pacearchaeota archaeon CG10_big_fil_rev_8_21_14_0_10_32_42]